MINLFIYRIVKMTETSLSDQPSEVVDMKGSVKNKGRYY